MKGTELTLDDSFGELVVPSSCKALVSLRYPRFFRVSGRLTASEFDDILKVTCEFKGVSRSMSDCGENSDATAEGRLGRGTKDCIGGRGG